MNPKYVRWSVIASVLAAIVVKSIIKSNRKSVMTATRDEYEEFLGI